MRPSFRKRDDAAAVDLGKKMARAKVALKTIAHRSITEEGGGVSTVLPPEPGDEKPTSQNVASLVIAIEHYDKTVLLTGELEPPGTQRFLSQPDLPKNLLAMMVPHHGSPAANPDYPWRRLVPKFVFSSEGEERRTRPAEGVLAKEIPLWKTQEKGTITLEIGPKTARAIAYAAGEIMILEKAPSSK